jgi:hypothetical protein
MEVRAEVEWFVQIMIRRKKLKTITPSNAVKKIGPKEGRTIQIGNARLTWKDTGYGTSVYEMDLARGVCIPVHSIIRGSLLCNFGTYRLPAGRLSGSKQMDPLRSRDTLVLLQDFLVVGGHSLIYQELPCCGRSSTCRRAAFAKLSDISRPAFCHCRMLPQPGPIHKQSFLVQSSPTS